MLDECLHEMILVTACVVTFLGVLLLGAATLHSRRHRFMAIL